MSKWKKRLLIALSILLVAIATVFIIFHDDSDLEEVARKQNVSIEEATSDDKFDAISDDFQDFEDSISVNQ